MNLREIDRLVAEKVMGWKVSKGRSGLEWYEADENGKFEFIRSVTDFEPSTDIRDSWQVVEELIDRGYDFNLWRSEQREYNAEFQIQKKDGFVVSYGESDHAPTAICFASLEAVGVDVE